MPRPEGSFEGRRGTTDRWPIHGVTDDASRWIKDRKELRRTNDDFQIPEDHDEEDVAPMSEASDGGKMEMDDNEAD